ncbi:MAG: hypothetical protein A2Y62_03845 [Candidatus Fischerbacteria bacterium RBG_13_37_8]|uniref:Dihydrolipoamide acetyltransferase component of pyruvate dehydrogenase complex n=1 Tax=Candidatus Fischerbacteria bacterium RBG_13_37_8 TaxID=1817863 RepID=A0A1F5V5F8_9BACT|nr:MAG: hypothetical protein A2Y62_03845 [Candidatus Fischerbacteria bacterium RBG_13_37_8]
MIFEFKLPDIGEGVVEGEIVEWKVKPGDEVIEDQPMVEVMTDKATVELPSPKKGKIVEINGKAGDKIKVGAILLKIEVADDTDAKVEQKKEQPTERDIEKKQVSQKEETVEMQPEEKARVIATLAIRKLARDMNIELAKIKGSGEGGRVLREDLMQLAQGEKEPTTKEEKIVMVPSEMHEQHKEEKVVEMQAKEQGQFDEDIEKAEVIEVLRGVSESATSEEIIPYIGLRRKIGERMSLSKSKVPHFSYVDEVDMTEIVQTRQNFLPIAEERNVKLTFLPFIIKALVAALKKYPMANSSLDEEKNEIILKKYYNIGIATATEKGLIVPVVKNADKKSILQIAVDIERIGTAAKAGKVLLEDLQGGTFSITNVGSIGGLFSSPIINYPEVGIMGVHKIHKRPVVRQNTMVIRDMMYISFCFDHRIVDGAMAAEFAKYLIHYLENPSLLFIDMV